MKEVLQNVNELQDFSLSSVDFIIFTTNTYYFHSQKAIFIFFKAESQRVKFHRFTDILITALETIKTSYNNEQLTNGSMYVHCAVFLTDYLTPTFLISGPLPSSTLSKASFAYALPLACKSLLSLSLFPGGVPHTFQGFISSSAKPSSYP